MSDLLTWSAALVTVALLVGYELALLVEQRRRPARLGRSAHATLRQEWFAAVSALPGSEILAVQTLRNSLMSATMTASTALLALIGAATLSAPSLHASFSDTAGLPYLSARLALELVLVALLFASIVSSAMAVRFYNHVGFICGMPVGSDARQHWTTAGTRYVRRAGLLYSWGLRHLIFVAPILASIVHPLAGPPAAIIIIVVMYGFDHRGVDEPPLP